LTTEEHQTDGILHTNEITYNMLILWQNATDKNFFVHGKRGKRGKLGTG
jgi:hypothetical protein